ncbi:hypothetical protein AVEN_24940-1 [Araneus ventricosus]|uniref:Uncharacterized protein n=1 Tax=Araneus ventricosus TaxID=182803 RepID=A0A4Y2PTZ4_ARAVE|nr:hypothetical protein AVEN_24940-1 [Araneus ventricosus]
MAFSRPILKFKRKNSLLFSYPVTQTHPIAEPKSPSPLIFNTYLLSLDRVSNFSISDPNSSNSQSIPHTNCREIAYWLIFTRGFLTFRTNFTTHLLMDRNNNQTSCVHPTGTVAVISSDTGTMGGVLFKAIYRVLTNSTDKFRGVIVGIKRMRNYHRTYGHKRRLVSENCKNAGCPRIMGHCSNINEKPNNASTTNFLKMKAHF